MTVSDSWIVVLCIDRVIFGMLAIILGLLRTRSWVFAAFNFIWF